MSLPWFRPPSKAVLLSRNEPKQQWKCITSFQENSRNMRSYVSSHLILTESAWLWSSNIEDSTSWCVRVLTQLCYLGPSIEKSNPSWFLCNVSFSSLPKKVSEHLLSAKKFSIRENMSSLIEGFTTFRQVTFLWLRKMPHLQTYTIAKRKTLSTLDLRLSRISFSMAYPRQSTCSSKLTSKCGSWPATSKKPPSRLESLASWFNPICNLKSCQVPMSTSFYKS